MATTPEQKVEVIREFLIRQAKLGRVTNHFEVAVGAGLALAEKGYRKSAMPVRRGAVIEALGQINKEDGAPLLSALVVHFDDQLPGHRFTQYAADAGLIDPDAPVDGQEILDVHASQVQAVFAKYGAAVEV